MTVAGSSLRRRVGLFLGSLALIAAGLAVWAYVTGGFRVYVFGVPLSVRGESRPAALALLFGLGSLHLLDAWHSRAGARIVALLPRTAPWIALAAAICVLMLGLAHLSPVVGGSDSSGYLSQAELWMTADLRVTHRDVGTVPWPEPAWSFSPLGYRPDTAGKTIVPSYPPGLPILMAAATLVAGTCGPYFLSPICAALLVWATYGIGARLTTAWVGVVAALGVAVSPAVLFMSIQPMSDVPNAALWTLAMFFAFRPPTGINAVLAGVMAGGAILIRPNLAPLALIPAALLMAAPPDERGIRWRLLQAGRFAAGCAPFVAIVAATFNYLYGSPLRSGYGSLAETYSLSNASLNLSVYSRSFLDTQGLPAFAFLLAPLVAFSFKRQQRVQRLLCFFFVIAVLACYLFYTSFGEWWYLRFLLPAYPFVFLLGADAVSTIAARMGSVAQHVALVIFGVLVVIIGSAESSGRAVLGSHGERRYADAAAYVHSSLPAGAVVLTMQHSGSLAYYSDKLPLRYDLVPVEWIDRAVEHFVGGGRPVFVLLEDWEIPVFAERFRGQRSQAAVEVPPLAATIDGRVRLFAIGAARGTSSTAQMPRTSGCLPPAAGNLYRR